MATLYGIKNCDTVKKARKWLDENSINYSFHDFRQQGLDSKTLKKWAAAVEWQTLLNRRSTSWRELDDSSKQALTKEKTISLMMENPTLIKRPVIEKNSNIIAGFDENTYQNLFRK